MSKRLYREYDNKGNLIKLECSHCHEIKSVDNFCKCKSRKDGYDNKCKICAKVNHKKHYIKYRDKELKKQYEYRINNKDKIKEKGCKYYKNNKDKIQQYYLNNRDKRIIQMSKYRKQYYLNNKDTIIKQRQNYCIINKDKISKYRHEYYIENTQEEIIKIYENVTKNLYPNNGIQYGIIYGVHCISSNKWYIGQTRTSFNNRYNRDFFRYKTSELSEDNQKLKLLQDDIEKYGKDKFEIFEVLDVAFSEKELDEKEAYYIDLYKAYDEGYNSNRGNIFKHNKSKRKEVI